MLVKCTMLIQLATNAGDTTPAARRVGGWSESHYYNGNSIEDCRTKFAFGNQVTGPSLISRRAALLPTGAAIVGQRFQLLNPVGISQSLNKVILGSSGIQADVPQMALLCKAPGVGVSNTRQLILRGIPDVRVVEGEYSPSAAFLNALQNYFWGLAYFAFKAKDLTQPKPKILAVEANGHVIWQQWGPVAAVGDLITISGVKNAAGVTISAQVKVKTLAPNFTVDTVEPWTHGYCTGGVAQAQVKFYPAFDSAQITVGRIIVKKVGRPFGQYVGRRSRKKTA